jgi:hypothetical protein
MLRSRLFALATTAFFVAAGVRCSPDAALPTDPGPAAAPAPNPSLLGGLLGGVTGTLLGCAPQPYAADTAVVGPAGGVLAIGPHRLVIPAGALSQRVTIIGDAPVGNVVSVRFQPEGLHFDARHPAYLTLDYSKCSLVRTLLPKRVAYTSDRLDILSYLLSIDDLFHHKVTGQVKHFSRYAVAW